MGTLDHGNVAHSVLEHCKLNIHSDVHLHISLAYVTIYFMISVSFIIDTMISMV